MCSGGYVEVSGVHRTDVESWRGEGVEGEAAEEVAAHAGVDLIETTGGGFDPLKGEGLREAFELGADVGVAE